MTALLVALGAAVGAPLRYLVDRAVGSHNFPWGTLGVNVAGSFLLGLLSGAALAGDGLAVLGVGFCGGFTTYSSFAVQTHRLGWARGAAYSTLTIVTALAACTSGYLIGQA